MKILLICFSGMSSSVLVTNMRNAIEKMGIDASVECLGSSESNQVNLDFDVVMLAPQIRYQKDKFAKTVKPGTPIEVIDSSAYGLLDGKKVVKQALAAYEKSKQ